MCKPILEGVTGGVVGLGAVADNAGDGAQHYEEVQVAWEAVVEVPGALDFGARCGGPLSIGHVFEVGIVEDHGGLNEALDWGHSIGDFGNGCFQGRGVDSVTSERYCTDAEGFEV